MSIFVAALLTIVWVVLREDFSPMTIIVGIGISICCLFFCAKYLPFKSTTNVNFKKLVLFPLFLITQIYMAGFYVLKIIFTGAKYEIVKIKTEITNETLKIILVDSITLTPGSVLLDLKDDIITILWLRGINDPADVDAGELIKGKLERKLLKAQK